MSQPIIELPHEALAHTCGGGKKPGLQNLVIAAHLYCERNVLDSDDNKAIGWKVCGVADHINHKVIEKVSRSR